MPPETGARSRRRADFSARIRVFDTPRFFFRPRSRAARRSFFPRVSAFSIRRVFFFRAAAPAIPPERGGFRFPSLFPRWCRRRDSNPHARRQRILSPQRLPFRHSGKRKDVQRNTEKITRARRAARVFSFAKDALTAAREARRRAALLWPPESNTCRNEKSKRRAPRSPCRSSRRRPCVRAFPRRRKR